MGIFGESTGKKRSIASILAILAAVAGQIPALLPYQAIIVNIAALFGGAGVAHAALEKNL